MGSIIHRHRRRFQASSNSWAAVAAFIASLAGLICGCTDSADVSNTPANNELRIVSFSPALSRMLVDLGLEDSIVGRTPYCEFLDDSIAVVGDLLRVDYERLVDLEPTHVLIQASDKGVDSRLLDLCDEHGWKRTQWTSLNTIEDIESVLRDIPGVLFNDVDAQYADLSQRVAVMLNDIALALTPGGEMTWRGNVLVVYSTQPVGVFGRDTYLNDVLVRLGATNAVPLDGWPNLSLEDIVHLNPQAIVLVKPGTALDADTIELLGAVGELDIEATRSGRIATLRHPAAMLPSTGIIGTADELREILASWPNVDAALEESAP